MLPLLSLAGNFVVEEAVPLTSREATSGIFGSISLACWIFVLVPQLFENYRNGNAEAISLTFLVTWFIGDAANLIGGVWAGLVPIIVLIAVYYCLADGVLIAQCLYYRARNQREAHRRRRSSIDTPDPTTPLLGRRFSDSMHSTQRDALYVRRPSQAEEALAKVIEERDTDRNAWFKNLSSVLAICVIGLAGWTVAWQMGLWKPAPPEQKNGGVDMALGAQVFGYISAVAYLGARLPQIHKNYTEKSCEGLSLLFFILSLMGNLTYGAGILCHSTDINYVITNLPWLIGSLGTMAEDVMIFVQFRLYAVRDSDESPASTMP